MLAVVALSTVQCAAEVGDPSFENRVRMRRRVVVDVHAAPDQALPLEIVEDAGQPIRPVVRRDQH